MDDASVSLFCDNFCATIVTQLRFFVQVDTGKPTRHTRVVHVFRRLPKLREGDPTATLCCFALAIISLSHRRDGNRALTSL